MLSSQHVFKQLNILQLVKKGIKHCTTMAHFVSYPKSEMKYYFAHIEIYYIINHINSYSIAKLLNYIL